MEWDRDSSKHLVEEEIHGFSNWKEGERDRERDRKTEKERDFTRINPQG